MNSTDFNQLFASLNQLKVAVVGDVMLDTYLWGGVERISPEAPVPVVTLRKKEHRIGGAGNVALNTVALGAETTLFSVIGNDDDAEVLMGLLQKENIDTKYIVKSEHRITTNKTRIISRNQQMMRLDSEVTNDIDTDDEQQLLQSFTAYVQRYQPAVVIFEDYNKGVLTPRCIAQMIAICKEQRIITTVDPKRKNFFAFKGVDIFKPNLKEVSDSLNLISNDVSEQTLRQIHEALYQQLQHKISLITLSEKGVFFQKGNASKIVTAHLRNIADVSGAGDTVIATASLIYAATGNINIAGNVANIAGGLVCEEVGTAAIDKQKLIRECELLLKNL
ncbi:MAG: bifunctional heptose 7-phosphate kinase/heptose 1-phosphate adenyltransferase [Chitinophagaceae bacterium]